ncbi:collagen alpha-6(VI) chain [Hydra vulgaris]|uniref:collagen alpha-6(VI) chain n=1 Tax=Hydra vulgaris TaxID=6087 RepID=UPI0032EA5260
MGSTTRIDKALRLAQKEVFELENGARPGVAKILFLLTDGSQTQERGSENPVAIANELRSAGVTIIVIGITNAVNVSELSDIAGGEENAYAAESFEKLKDVNFLDVIKTKMCETANVTSFITSTASVPTSTSSSSSTTSSTTAEPSTTTQSLETVAKVQPTCEAIVDIVFLLDSSGSLRKYYQNEKDFLKSVISAFGVSFNGTRAAVITFSYHAQLSIKLNKYSNLNSFKEAVDNIVLMGSTTRIDKALRLAQKEVFELENGARPGVAKILFLLTDGSQTQERGSENPVAIANELRSAGVTIIVIGITNAVNVSELSDIAGGEENAYAAESFEKLKDVNFLDVIKTKMCETANVTSFITSTASVPTSTSSSSSTTSSTTAEPSTTTQSLETVAKVQPTCEAIVDIVFLLDSSGSLRKYYQNEKDFLKSVISAFGVSFNGTRAAVITFSYHAQLSIKLNKYSNLNSFKEAVDNIVLMGSTTRIDKALRLAQKEVFELENGARPGVAKILFLLTDGSQTQERGSENPVAIANELRSAGVTIIVIGITNAVNVSELSDIAGGEENAYAAESFEKLKDVNFLDVIKTKMCETANVTSFITSTASVPTSTSSSSSTTSSTTAEPSTTTQSLETVAKVQPTCEAIVDIVFLLDSSGSLRKYYQNEKDFLKSVISAFGVSFNGTRAAVITFSYHAQLSIKLNKYSNLNSFKEAVDNIVLMGSTTRIDKALRLAQKEVFELENGARPGVAKILFLLTDGSQTQERGSENPVAIANELRSAGVTIIVIGITNAVNVSELSDIAGGEENAYAAESFEKLKDVNFLDVIKTKMCETANVTSFITSTASVPTSTSSSSSTTSSTTAEPSTTTQSLETVAKVQPTCEAIVDIVFLLDSSGSLRKYYQNEKDFLKSVISAFGVSFNGTRAAVITFSYHAQLSIKLNKYSNLNSFKEAVDNIVLMGSTTRIDKALRLAQKEVFELENGARPGVAKILFLLTDGSQTQERGSENPVAIANELRSAGVTIIVIGITNAVNVSELSDIAGGEENAYAAESFEKLKDVNFLDVIKTKMCETANVTSFITSTASVPTSTSSSSSTTSSTTAEPSTTTQSLETVAKVQPTCEAIVDIVFLLDSSGSLRKYYQNEKDFLKSVISAFGVSFNGTRAAVITFSYHAQLSIKLNKYSNLNSFKEAVDNIVLMGSTTRIDKALRLAQKEVFELENGARPGVAKILFLLTDGSQTQERGSENPVAIANELRSAGVTIIVIGITNAVNVSELSDIAGGEENAYAAESFEKLKDVNFLDVIKTKMCETANVTSFITSTASVPTSTSSSSSTTSSTTAEPSTTTQSLETVAKVQPTCEAIVDIVFLLDSSGSLRKYYQNEKDFLKSVISAFGVSFNGTRAAVITFSYHAQLSIKLNKYSNLNSFKEAVDNIVLMGSTTRIDKALRLAQKEVFELENGARPGVAKILFLLTDGSQTQERGSENPVAIANELRSAGVTIIVIGITNAVNVSELSDIAGGEENAYAAESFEKLKDVNFLDVIKTKMCETANVTSFITSTASVPTSTSSSSSTTSSTTAEPSTTTQSLETVAMFQPTCEAVVDIVFLLDSSASLRKYYQNEKDFLKSLISAFGVSINSTRAAVITFSYHAQLSIKLNKYSNLNSFKEAVDNIVLMGSTTRIDKALRLAQKEVFELENGARPGVAKILFLLTDGSQTQERGSENPVVIANELRSAGVTIIVIGITNAVDVSELFDIAGGEENAYFADSFEKLKDVNFLEVVKRKMCETANVTL